MNLNSRLFYRVKISFTVLNMKFNGLRIQIKFLGKFSYCQSVRFRIKILFLANFTYTSKVVNIHFNLNALKIRGNLILFLLIYSVIFADTVFSSVLQLSNICVHQKCMNVISELSECDNQSIE